MKNLIPMTDFVKQQSEIHYTIQSYEQFYYVVLAYANFLKQPLELWMFVPCDEAGNVLEEPKIENMPFCSVNGEGYDYAILKYQQARERCLFEGLSTNKANNYYLIERDRKYIFALALDNLRVIEDLVKYNLELTEAAKKQLSL